jgi:alkyl hydroperoxide reductase subunit F
MSKTDILFDVAIIGYGPAGITAAIYSARKKMNVLLVGETPGGEVINSGEIENWPGGGKTDGLALSDNLVKHLELHKDEVTIIKEKVSKITKDKEDVFTCLGSEEYKAKSVIYAAGSRPRKLNVSGEEEFENRGVTYCATCDAPLFVGKDVAVIGGGNTGVEAVIMLQKIAKKIYLLHIDDNLPADKLLVNNISNDPNVKILYNAKTTEIKGDMMVDKLVYEDLKGEKKSELDVQGVFVSIGAVPNSDPVKDLVKLNDYGSVVTDRYGITSVEGFFAAGDVTDTRDAQIVVAAGHGCSAALSAGGYLSRREEKK